MMNCYGNAFQHLPTHALVGPPRFLTRAIRFAVCRLQHEVEALLPAQRHRILYTSAEMLSDARFTSQALATARANAQHAWSPLAVLAVALPMVGSAGAFAVGAVVLSVPELRKRLFVLLAVGTTEVRAQVHLPCTGLIHICWQSPGL